MANLPIIEFVNYIKSDESEKKIVYIAVGSAHHMARINNGIKEIEDRYNQQYPLYIKDLHLRNPDYKLYIVLIDPTLESPSFTVANKYINSENKLDDLWYTSKYDNIYENMEENVVVMEFRNYVRFDSNTNYDYGVESVDINDQIKFLNENATKNKWFVNVMDYTSRNLSDLARSYDKDIINDKDHIFYGLSTRIEGGCFVDLTQKSVYFVTNRDKGYISAFTPYLYNNEKLLKIYKSIEHCDDFDSQIIKEQIKTVTNKMVDSFKNEILSIYRRFLIYKNNISTVKINFLNHKKDCEYIKTKYGFDIGNIEEFKVNIDHFLFNISRLVDYEFISLCEFFNKNRLEEKYIQAKSLDDPYKMYLEICEITKEFI